MDFEEFAQKADQRGTMRSLRRNKMRKAKRMENPTYRKSFRRFFEVYTEAMSGSYEAYHLIRDALSTSDFPLLFGDTIDRVLLAQWKLHEPDMPYLHRDTMQDMRPAKRFYVSIGRGLGFRVGKGESYEHDEPAEDQYLTHMYKWGLKRAIDLETMLNDDLGAFKRTPQDFAMQARNTESVFATSLWSGNTDLYSTSHSVAGTTYSNRFDYPLTADALKHVISQMGQYPGKDGQRSPLDNSPIYIVVPNEAMMMRAEQILNSLVVTYTGDQDRDNLPTANIITPELRNRMRVVMNKWIGRSIKLGRNESATDLYLGAQSDADTSWYLFSDPNVGWSVEFDTLSGFDAPQLFMRTSNAVRLGGAEVGPMEGDYDSDAISYKWRHFFGGNSTEDAGGWRFTAFSYDGGGIPPGSP